MFYVILFTIAIIFILTEFSIYEVIYITVFFNFGKILDRLLLIIRILLYL